MSLNAILFIETAEHLSVQDMCLVVSKESKGNRYLKLIKDIAPPNGNIRTLLLTYNTFTKLGLILGKKTLVEQLLEQKSSVVPL